MELKNKLSAILATAISVAFVTAPATSSLVQAKCHASKCKTPCMGVNACKGQSSCKTANNSCKCMNNCKGTGMMMVRSKKKCMKMQKKMHMKADQMQDMKPATPASDAPASDAPAMMQDNNPAAQ